ncbi:MAG: DUF5943 domain-containing protein [SAR324 cluster bacterium]|nr:DUF5943 domain-containing protein [SAR324 cluster bacterium]MCZ6646470.1 DUF5943 domain-containing protein [SAR324 cluster bacterium]MCZ6844000.1 DUF5943 domain-containing protein [SAR324 cluster bacterium]
MATPQVPISVDPDSGVWSTDGLPMLYLPRHFFVNNHLAVEAALGEAAYARLLYDAGYKSAYSWCEQEAATHGLAGFDVFHHYMRRISQRGWGRFTPLRVDEASGAAAVRVEHSALVYQIGRDAGRKVCYMYAGWFPGALTWAGDGQGQGFALKSRETQCAAEGGQAHCLFEIEPA